MAINGCLTLAWLEEDDPSRGFFRVKPAVIIGAQPIEHQDEGAYGEEGFLRIVPDKNEMSTFKLRMRTLGRLCLIDLRQHPRENDKIRQNKNYIVGSDRNPYMIYSDVIREIPAGLVYQLLCEADSGVTITAQVFKRAAGEIVGPYLSESDEWVECSDCGHFPIEKCADRILELDDTQGGRVSLLFESVADVSELKLTPIADFVAPDREIKPHTAGDDGGLLPGFTATAAQNTAPAPETDAYNAPQDSPAPAQPDKPIEPQRGVDSLPYALKLLKEQVGLNPRKGRSLSEVVDEQWRMRRQEELGQSVPPLAQTEPVESPAQQAITALTTAWEFEGARAPIIEGIISNDELMQRLIEIYPPEEKHLPSDACMIELEAERLKMITELDGLKRRTREMKAEVLRELKCSNEVEADQLRNSIVLLDEEIEGRKAKIDELERQKAQLEGEIARALDKPITERLINMVADAKLGEVLGMASGIQAAPQPHPPLAEAAPVQLVCPFGELNDAAPEIEKLLVAPEALIDRMSLSLKAQGWRMKRDDIIHALTPIVLNVPLTLSGFAGQDDAHFAGAIIDALGDETLILGGRLNLSAVEMDIIPGRAVYSVLDYPEGQAVDARMLDIGFIMRDSSEICLPGNMPRYMAVDEKSYENFCAGELSARVGEKLSAFAAKLREFGAKVSHAAFVDCARYVAAAGKYMSGGDEMALDYALAYRLLPPILAAADKNVLRALPGLCAGLKECGRMAHCPLHIAAQTDAE